MSFGSQLAYGKIGESLIAQWLKDRGHSVLPVYEKEIQENKGPQLFTPDDNLVAPDMIAFKDDKVIWVEAKHKSTFTWHRITKRWVTGIDLHHYFDYLKVANLYPHPVWLLFLQRGGTDNHTGFASPSGLYGGSLKYLSCNENHRHNGWGKSGMVYWWEKRLTKMAELEDTSCRIRAARQDGTD